GRGRGGSGWRGRRPRRRGSGRRSVRAAIASDAAAAAAEAASGASLRSTSRREKGGFGRPSSSGADLVRRRHGFGRLSALVSAPRVAGFSPTLGWGCAHGGTGRILPAADRFGW